MSTPLRDFLTKRELELRQQISVIKTELADREFQLEEVLLARKALGETLDETPQKTQSPNEGGELVPLPLPYERMLPTITADMTSMSSAIRAAAAEAAKSIASMRFNGATIKELVVKALAEHYKENGASASELVSFLENAYGRAVERSSLSPQLSRLKEEGQIVQIDNSKWAIDPKYLRQLEEQAKKRREAAARARQVEEQKNKG